METVEIRQYKNDVIYQIPHIDFVEFEAYKEKANEIADYINSIVLTEENAIEVKATLADARRIVDGINRVRIDIKKEILTHYQDFETQVKELSGIIDSADHVLRDKVKALEDLEREQKKEDLQSIFLRRLEQYDRVREYFPDCFLEWLKPTYLTKSCSRKKAEESMIEFLDIRDKDIEGADACGEEYLIEYIKVKNLSVAIKNVDDRKKIQKTIAESKEETKERTATFKVFGDKDINFTETLLKANNINYERN